MAAQVDDFSEKHKVALNSVWAAIFLTSSKLTIGLMTGSLGILSEALHSGLDLVAAAITYFSVRVSDKPADEDHHFGHGKIENLSALIETLLLLITCIWIIYEAVSRISTGNIHFEVTKWSYIVVITSIIIDVWRSKVLKKAAKKYNSQALEADALHFSSDIWSSVVVLIGLICSNYGIFLADSIAALAVAVIVIGVSFRLGKKAIDDLLDKAPKKQTEHLHEIINNTEHINNVTALRVRQGGADLFIDICADTNANISFDTSHKVIHNIESKIKEFYPRSIITVHLDPK